ncbi:MAG: hypothetical protein FJ285_03940 [Planctomycetes bacterium]|nr:hypothetical protein [Planctomycetota bacterium]
MHSIRRWLHLGALLERELFASKRTLHLPVADAVGSWCLRCGATVDGVSAPPHWPPYSCAACAGSSRPWTAVVRLGAFGGNWRDAVLAVKYGRDRRCGEQLGERLAEQWMRVFAALPSLRHECGSEWCAVPVPMPWARRIERGIDHAQVIAKAFARASSMRLMRVLSQQPGVNQAKLDRSARVTRGGRMRWRTPAFDMCGFLDRQRAMTVRQWVIVDDVKTTGATLREVAEVLRAHTPHARIAAAIVSAA